MLLLLAGEDRDELSVPPGRRGGGHVAAVAGRFPGEPGPGSRPPGGRRPGRGQAAEAVLEHGAGGGGADGGEGGEHEHVGIPEHVAAVGAAGQAPGADRGLAGVRGGAEQVEHGEARRQLVTG